MAKKFQGSMPSFNEPFVSALSVTPGNIYNETASGGIQGGGTPKTVSKVTTYTQCVSEIQRLSLNWSVGFSSYKLNFNGQITPSLIQQTATAAQVQTALEGLSNINPGDILVTGSFPGYMNIEFFGQYDDVDVPQITFVQQIYTDDSDASYATNTISTHSCNIGGVVGGGTGVKNPLIVRQPKLMGGGALSGSTGVEKPLEVFNPKKATLGVVAGGSSPNLQGAKAILATGGITVGGSGANKPVIISWPKISPNGALAGGLSFISKRMPEVSHGDALVNGSVIVGLTVPTTVASGGALGGGTAIEKPVFVLRPKLTGGGALGGSMAKIVNVVRSKIASVGAIGGGTAKVSKVIKNNTVGLGGVLVVGSTGAKNPLYISRVKLVSSGVVIGSTASLRLFERPKITAAGARLGSTTQIFGGSDRSISGGILADGKATPHFVRNLKASGGALAAGKVYQTYKYIATGGMVIAGAGFPRRKPALVA